MANSQKRRDFIKSVSLAGASIAIVNPVSAGSTLPESNEDEIQNDHLTVTFDKTKGTIRNMKFEKTTRVQWEIKVEDFFK